ncbi:MAG: catalase [Archangium sp.]
MATRKKTEAADQRAETHQVADGSQPLLTTQTGTPISDNQNSLKSSPRGPTLLEDFVLREKITSFDHERIPERIVHARGTAAHGYFQPTKSLAKYTRAALFADPKKKTPVFVRFSTVAGGAGSVDTPRDVRGFAVKFYTEEGNWDLVGNNIPVFFIQDAMKFPDLIHSVKMEPDRGFPQAASAHDTFWDFVSLMPESMHMIMWAMSDRTIPRSLRMIEGFGVHTFKLINARGEVTFVKFHWRPKLQTQSTTWDEALKIAGMDPDFHRRDLWKAIDSGNFPQWDLAVQAFDQKTADQLDFDVLDPTKLIPEEIIPLEVVGTMTLGRNPDNFFAETEQVAFHPGNLVPGIDVSEGPLLQGRLFSYVDTQLSRLGSPNYNELPINAPKCPMHHFQRDGHMRTTVPKGRVSYEPNSLDPKSARETPLRGFVTYPSGDHGPKTRLRAESFADHYSQARQFFRSMSEPEKQHMISALTFELSMVETKHVRQRVLGHLANVDADLFAGVEAGLGMEGEAEFIEPKVKPRDLEESPSLSLVKKFEPTLKGREVGVYVTDGTDGALFAKVKTAIENAGAVCTVIAPVIGGVTLSTGKKQPADKFIQAGTSVFYDAIALLPSAEGAAKLEQEAAAVDAVRDAFGHLKVIGYVGEAGGLIERASIQPDDGVVTLDAKSVAEFIKKASGGRIFEREPGLRDIERQDRE